MTEFNDPMEIRVRYDFSEADRQVEERERRLGDQGVTFSSEGRRGRPRGASEDIGSQFSDEEIRSRIARAQAQRIAGRSIDPDDLSPIEAAPDRLSREQRGEYIRQRWQELRSGKADRDPNLYTSMRDRLMASGALPPTFPYSSENAPLARTGGTAAVGPAGDMGSNRLQEAQSRLAAAMEAAAARVDRVLITPMPLLTGMPVAAGPRGWTSAIQPTGIIPFTRGQTGGWTGNVGQGGYRDPDFVDAEWSPQGRGLMRRPYQQASGIHEEVIDAEWEAVRPQNQGQYASAAGGLYPSNWPAPQPYFMPGGPPNMPGGPGGRGGGPPAGRAPGSNLFRGLYGRFIAMELLRSTGAMAHAVRQDSIDRGMAMGDNAHLAQAELRFSENIAQSMPFGIGRMAQFIRDPSGSAQLGVELPIAQAALQDQGNEARWAMGTMGRALGSRAEALGTPIGTQRSLVEIEQRRQDAQRDITKSVAAAGDAAAKENAMERSTAERSGYSRRVADWAQSHYIYTLGIPMSIGASIEEKFGSISTGFQSAWGTEENIQAANRRAADRRANRGAEERRMRQAADQVAKRETEQTVVQEDLQLSAVQTQGDVALNNLGIYAPLPGGDMGLISILGRESIQQRRERAERFAMVQRQRQDYAQMMATNPTLLMRRTMQAAHRAETQEFDAATAQDQATRAVTRGLSARVFGIGVEGGIAAAGATALNETFTAQMLGAITHGREQIESADPSRRAQTEKLVYAQLDALQSTQARQMTAMAVQQRSTTDVLNQQIARQPLAATLAGIWGQRNLAWLQTPADAIDPTTGRPVQEGIDPMFEAMARERSQQYWDSRRLETMALKRGVRVSELRAEAYGPDAFRLRKQAQAEDIAGHAEEKAQAILQEDAGNMENADRARQIGINELRSMKAEYMSSFTAASGSARRTALMASQQAGVTVGPNAVLNSIDREIKNLNRKLGTLVATD